MIHTTTRYEELDMFIEEFVEGSMNLMLVRGRGGTGKTRRLQRFLDDGKVELICGCAITPFDLYCKLHAFRDRPIVIDDIDFLWKDSKCVNLLKLVCQTDEVKRLAWNSARLSNPGDDHHDDDHEDDDEESPEARETQVDDGNVPNRFETRSRIMIIANSWHVKDANLEALMTRGVDIVFEPSGREVHEEARQFCDDPEVYEFIGQWAPIVKVNFRDYVNASQLNRRKRVPWKQMLLNGWGVSDALVFVHHLETDPEWSHRPTPEKIEEFAKQNFSQGSSKSRYYELRSELIGGRSSSSYVLQPHVAEAEESVELQTRSA